MILCSVGISPNDAGNCLVVISFSFHLQWSLLVGKFTRTHPNPDALRHATAYNAKLAHYKQDLKLA